MSTSSRALAQRELAKMKSVLAKWLRVCEQLEEAANGLRPAKMSPEAVRLLINAHRDPVAEERLATQLRSFLGEVLDPATVNLNALDAKALAEIVVTGKLPTTAAGLQAQGIGPLILLVILGGAGWAISRTVSSYAEIEYQRRRGDACIAGIASACGQPTWLKWAAAGGIAYLLLGDEIKHWLGLGRAKLRSSRAHKYLEAK